MKQRFRFTQNLTLVHGAASLEVLYVYKPSRVSRAGSGNEHEDLLEHVLVTWYSQGSLISEAVLFLGLSQELLEDGVVKVRRAYNESPAGATHGDRHVSRRHIGRYACCGGDAVGGGGGGGCVLAPLPEHLPDSDNVTDFVAFPDRRRHCFFLE